MKPLFPTITAGHWRQSIARARATPNAIRDQIRDLTPHLLTTESGLVRRPTREPTLPPQRIKIGPQ